MHGLLLQKFFDTEPSFLHRRKGARPRTPQSGWGFTRSTCQKAPYLQIKDPLGIVLLRGSSSLRIVTSAAASHACPTTSVRVSRRRWRRSRSARSNMGQHRGNVRGRCNYRAALRSERYREAVSQHGDVIYLLGHRPQLAVRDCHLFPLSGDLPTDPRKANACSPHQVADVSSHDEARRRGGARHCR